MLTDSETNKVYFSFQSTYDFKEELRNLRRILYNHKIPFGHIAGTRDYFCRDYMPVQVTKNRFVQFKFQPGYLLNNPALNDCVTNTDDVHRKNPFLSNKTIIHSDIILDAVMYLNARTRS